jgi:hypothetical protein
MGLDHISCNLSARASDFVTRNETPLLALTIAVGMIGLGILAAGLATAVQNNALKAAIDLQAKNLPSYASPSAPMQIAHLMKAVSKTQHLAMILYMSGCGTALVSLLAGVFIHKNKGPCDKAKWVALGALALLTVGIGMMIGYGLWTNHKVPRVFDKSVYLEALKSQQNLYVVAINFMVVGMMGTSIALLYNARLRAPQRD